MTHVIRFAIGKITNYVATVAYTFEFDDEQTVKSEEYMLLKGQRLAIEKDDDNIATCCLEFNGSDDGQLGKFACWQPGSNTTAFDGVLREGNTLAITID